MRKIVWSVDAISFSFAEQEPQLSRLLGTKRAKSLHDKRMNIALIKALVALALVSLILIVLTTMFARQRTVSRLLQLVGVSCFTIVALTHVCEALHLFPWMHWGEEHSIGHYLDFASAILGLTLFSAGYLLQALTKRRA